jgi:multiple sugar transport system substrate-binding protein
MKDIARLAKVSYGTVSNVLNQRGNVNSEKIRAVEDAIRQLKYSSNALAQKLRQEKNRHTAFIMPDIDQGIYRAFYTNLKTMLEGIDYDTSLHLTGSSPDTERDCIKSALSNRSEYIVSFTCTDDPDEYSASHAKVIFVNNPFISPLKNQASIYFDFEEAASAFAEKISRGKSKNIAFFLDSMNVPANRAFFHSLEKLTLGRLLTLEPFVYDSRQVYQGAINILEHSPAFDLVITSNPGYAEKLTRAQALLERELPAILTFGMSETIPPRFCQRYAFDYRELARRVFSVIQDAQEGKRLPDQPLKIRAQGFVRGFVNLDLKSRGEDRELNMLTVASPTAGVLKTLAPFFKRCTGIRLKIAALPYEELFQLLSTDKVANVDLIRIDMAWRSKFEKEYYRPLENLTHKIKPLENSFVPAIKEVYAPDTRGLYSMPFDPSIQLLFYRRDLFENSTIKRKYYEKVKKQLKVPETFKEYAETAAFFTASLNVDSPIRFGTTMVYGSAIVAACELLPRLKSMGGSFFDKPGRLRINSDVFKEALDDYLEMKRYSDPEIHYWWDNALKSFSSGLSAMTIIFSNHTSGIIHSNDSGLFLKAGAAPVPGGCPLLGGGSIGISRQSKNTDRCIEFFNWAYSDEIANMISLLGGFSPCKSVYANEEILEVYPWFRNMESEFRRGWRDIGSKHYSGFDNIQFERILGNAVRNAALGFVSSAEALDSAQKQCEKELGTDKKSSRG